MGVTVKLKHLRIAPRKTRLVADLIRGKSVEEAENILEFTRKKASRPLRKLLASAVATAEKDFQKKRSNLYISKVTVDEGPTLKRFRFRGGGRIFGILKRTSHITLSLDEIEPEAKKAKKTRRAEKAKKEVMPEREIKEKKATKEEHPRPKPRIRIPRPKFRKDVKKMFRRKAF